jgi:hypothetical protein
MSDTESLVDKLKRERAEQTAQLEARQQAAPAAPSVRFLCLEQTLYAPIQINPSRDERYLKSLKYGPQQFDAHCVYCDRATTFRTLIDRGGEDIQHLDKVASFNNPAQAQLRRLIFEGGQFALHIGCSRRPEHHYSYFFHYDEMEAVLIKIGQIPSLEDVAGVDIERYRKILGKDFAELRRATGLFAHGIGIGAFVYLRRIFENLIEDARLAADPNDERKGAFIGLKMADRIKELSAHLPSAVVKYKDAYGILSKGLHELTEADCKKYFPVVRAAIIAMLEQRYEAEEKAKAASDLDRAIAAIASEAKGK